MRFHINYVLEQGRKKVLAYCTKLSFISDMSNFGLSRSSHQFPLGGRYHPNRIIRVWASKNEEIKEVVTRFYQAI
ncbi:hypothetical protein E2R55_06105 [Vibrio vulnificus]|nr:hypothetical protein E2R55_06105 [Vibrio vulnificus]